jgi:hypothetical protein
MSADKVMDIDDRESQIVFQCTDPPAREHLTAFPPPQSYYSAAVSIALLAAATAGS